MDVRPCFRFSRLRKRHSCAALVLCFIIFLGTRSLHSTTTFFATVDNSARYSHLVTSVDHKDRLAECPSQNRSLDEQSVGGIYMENTTQLRALADFKLQPLKAQRTLLKGACDYSPEAVKWGMAFMVKSAVSNGARRDVIRRTWGSVKVFDDVMYEVIFIVGTSADLQIQAAVEMEEKHYGDILQVDMEDNAGVVPEKVLAGMQWASNNLPRNWLYASMDDDVVVNYGNLTPYFSKLMDAYKSTSGDDVCFENLPIACVYSYQPRDVPVRDRDSKWYMPPENYPDEFWPVYCRGGMYTISCKMVTDLFEVSRRTIRLYLDDVWITGFMRRKLGFGDGNIVAAPVSTMSETEIRLDHDINTLLVKHLWGNTIDVQVNVPSEMMRVWSKLEPTIENRIMCKA